MSYAIRVTGSVGADENQIICHQRVTVEALLVAVSTDVIAPLQLTRGFINRVKVPRARTDEHDVPHDRGGREHSTPGLILPAKFWSNRGGKVGLFSISHLSAADSRDRYQNECGNKTSIIFHSYLAEHAVYFRVRNSLIKANHACSSRAGSARLVRLLLHAFNSARYSEELSARVNNRASCLVSPTSK